MENEISERPWPCIVFFGISTCVIYSPKPAVAARLAVLLAVVHLPALEVVEQLARPASPRTIKSPAIYIQEDINFLVHRHGEGENWLFAIPNNGLCQIAIQKIDFAKLPT